MFTFTERDLYGLNLSTITPDDPILERWFALVYRMKQNTRSYLYDTESVRLYSSKEGNGFPNSRICRYTLKEHYIITSFTDNQSRERIRTSVMKLKDLLPYLKGEKELPGIAPSKTSVLVSTRIKLV